VSAEVYSKRVRGGAFSGWPAAKPALHRKQIADGDRAARIAVRRPLGRPDRLVDAEPPLLHQHREQRVGERLRDRVAEQRRRDPEPGRVALGHDLAVLHHHHGLHQLRRVAGMLREDAIQRGAQRGIARLDQARGREVVRRRCGARSDRLRRRNLRVPDHPAAVALGEGGACFEEPPHEPALGRLLARVDAVAQPRARHVRHRLHELAEHRLGVDALDECGRARVVCGECRRDAQRAVDPQTRERGRERHGSDQCADQRCPNFREGIRMKASAETASPSRAGDASGTTSTSNVASPSRFRSSAQRTPPGAPQGRTPTPAGVRRYGAMRTPARARPRRDPCRDRPTASGSP